MSAWTPTAMASEPQRERPSSSQSTAVVRKSAPAPPYFSSYSTPRKPSAPIRGQMDFGICPAASHSSMCGATSLSTKLRTTARNISCSSLKIFTQPPPHAKLLPSPSPTRMPLTSSPLPSGEWKGEGGEDKGEGGEKGRGE